MTSSRKRISGKPKLDPPPPKFDEWFRCLFQRPPELAAGAVRDDRYFALQQDHEFEATDAEVCDLVGYTLRQCGRVLESCSNEQAAAGLRLIFSNAESNICYQLIRGREIGHDPLLAITATFKLYADFLAKRCTPVLGHLNEVGDDLNGICYMLWDISPLAGWAAIRNDECSECALPAMLAKVLRIPHNACIESALHGLGHMHHRGTIGAEIESIIDLFLAQTPGLRPELRYYAQCARTGRIL